MHPGRLVFQGGNRQRPLLSIRLRYVRPARRLRSVRPTVDPFVQVPEPRLKVCLVVLPRHAIHPGSGLALERVERRPKRVDIDMVEERSEPFLLPLPCGFPYAVQRLGHASPVLCPVRALLAHVPLGRRPWLHRLRHRLPGFVRRLHSYYAGVRLLLSVHHRLRLLAFPMRTGMANATRPDKRSPRFRRVPFMRDAALDPGRATVPRLSAPQMLPSTDENVSAPAILSLSWLTPTPRMIAAYASPWSSPPTPQHLLPGGRYPLPGPDSHRLERASLAWRTSP